MLSTIFKTIWAHKIIAIIVLIIIIGGGYYWYSSTQSAVAVTKYVIEDATQGTIDTSVTGSGQTQSVTSIDVKPQVTETVTGISVKVGDHVTAGQLLISLDSTNEEKSLKQAQLSLQSAQLSLAKLQEAPTDVSLAQDQDAVTKAQEDLLNASTTLQNDYQNGFDALGSSFVDFQNTMAELQSFVGGMNVNKSQSNPDAYVNLMPNYLQAGTEPYRDDVEAEYTAASAAYQTNLADYHSKSRYDSEATLDSLFSETYTTAKLISEAVKSAKGMLDYVIDNYPTNLGLAPLPTVTNTFETSFGGYTATASNDVGNISSAINSIASDKIALSNDSLALTEASDTLDQLVTGADPLDIQSQQLSIQQAQISVQNAQQQVDDCYLRAPIDGEISAITAVVGETVPSSAISMVAEGQVAEVTLNEVDAAKVEVGQEATLTFDAISGLSLAGKVVEIDPVGTVSQGVVNYNVQVSFNDTKNQVKPGMSTTAVIITQVHPDVVVVPNSAVTTQGSVSYIMVPSETVASSDISASAQGGIVLATAPKRVMVTTGLVNDSETEITSGLTVGDPFIVETIKTTAGATTAATSQTGASSIGSLGRLVGGGGGGGFSGGGAGRL